jgi:phosphoglycerate dehydrogenase-like enzyme
MAVTPYPTLFITERGLRHQAAALRAAPRELDVTMLRNPDRALLISHLAETVFLVSERSGTVDSEMISAAPNLRMIVRLGSLVHDIDLTAARAAEVVVCALPQPAAGMVAEHCVLQMLALAKKLRRAERAARSAEQGRTGRRTDEDTFSYNWTRQKDIGGISGRTVGILGFGETGAALARRLVGWDCRVIYYRRRRLPAKVEAALGIEHRGREQLVVESDFLVVLLPYTSETDLSVGAAEFEQMKTGASVIGCGSGSVIDEAALAEAIRAGHLAGAALDTFEWEPPPPDNPLLRLANHDPDLNILLTPHLAAGAPPAGPGSARAGDFAPILQYLRGEPIDGRIA